MKKDELQVEVYGTRDAMGAAAAERVAARIGMLLERQPFVNMVFAAAPSQNEFLRTLRASAIDWSRVRGFHMDEYIGLPMGAMQSFGLFLRENLFGRAPFAEVYYINGNSFDPEEECRRYSALLEQFPADIVCMGIGENGHIAFNDPPVANFNDPLRVKVVELDAACRQQQVNDGCFPTLDAVPELAMTLTIPALMAGQYIYCIVPGPSKAAAVSHTLNEKIEEAYPASILRKHPRAILFLDQSSSANLTIQSV